MDELRGDQGRRQPDRPALRRRRDDRAGRHQERRRVQPPHRRHRRRADQDRRRRARRRGAVGRVGRRRADRVRRQRRAARRSRAVPSRRVVSRILGMGDVLYAHREGRAGVDRRRPSSSKRSSARTSSRSSDFRDQLRTIRKMGRSSRSWGCCRAWASLKEMRRQQVDEKQLGRVEAIINSMTPEERGDTTHQRQPPQAHRARQRHVGRGRQPAAEAVHPDEEDAEGVGGLAMAAAARPPAEEDGRAEADDAAAGR